MIKDGGPAFPLPRVERKADGEILQWEAPGMSLRDYFAAKAMQGMIGDIEVSQWVQGDPRYQKQPDGSYNFNDVIAVNAYEFADAMLKARGK